MKLTALDVEKLILLCKVDGEPDTSAMTYFKQRDYINRQHGDTWREYTEYLSDADLICLFKALIYLEKRLGWIGGSVAGAIWVYGVIRGRGLDDDFALSDFALRNCDNPWIPFGASYHGTRTIQAYTATMAAKARESQRKAVHYQKVLKRVEGRKKIRAAAIAAVRQLGKEERGRIRMELLEAYQNATTYDRLKLMADDKIYPPEYYPPEWIVITTDELEHLPAELIKQLYDKLSSKTRGE